MASYSYTPQYYSTTAVPIPSSKDDPYSSYSSYGYGYGYQSGGSTYSVSPPEADLHEASVTSSGGASYGHSGMTTGSGGDYCSDGTSSAGVSASGVDFNEYMQDRFAGAFDPIPLDRSLVQQAQTSGNLNAKQRQLLEMQAKAQARLAKSRARFTQGVQDAQEVRTNLEWTSKKVSSMKKKAEKKHSREYQKARERYPSPEY